MDQGVLGRKSKDKTNHPYHVFTQSFRRRNALWAVEVWQMLDRPRTIWTQRCPARIPCYCPGVITRLSCQAGTSASSKRSLDGVIHKTTVAY
jgi:hypothetical protein